MPVAPQSVVAPPAKTPPVHSLLSSANIVTEMDDRWEGGLSFFPENCGESSCWAPCPPRVNCVPTVMKDDCPPCDLEQIDYQPFVVYSTYVCSSFSAGPDFDFYARKARGLLLATEAKTVESEFWNGTCVPTNPHLSEPVTVVDPLTGAVDILTGDPYGAPSPAQTPGIGIAQLVNFLSQCNGGSRGMIHAVPMLVQRWAHCGAIHEVVENGRRRFETAVGGHIIVPGSGYDGTGPGGVAPPAGQAYVYATGMVDIRMGEIKIQQRNMEEALNRRDNSVTVRAERTFAAVHDGCCFGALLVDTCGPMD